jgi:hypothetical protein
MKQMPRYRITRYEHQPYDGFVPVFCVHCGKQIQHLYELVDTETDTTLYPVGSGCVFKIAGKTVALINAENAEYEAQLQGDEEKEAKARKSREWQIANAETLAGLEALADGAEHYIFNAEDMFKNLAEWGTLTDKQLAYAQRMIENAERYCSKQEYTDTMHIVYFLRCEVRLSRYDNQFLEDIIRGERYGITFKQAEAVRKIAKKYRRQISENVEGFTRWHMDEVLSLDNL